ncbi:hypothetical protein BC829DRAFT_403885 [Chytridium lagenaria]|nr:hypothetical protein BC829DRAFT_403885 [Chytridium lagenaria]
MKEEPRFYTQVAASNKRLLEETPGDDGPVVKRRKVPIDELKKIKTFNNYNAGTPSPILFVKNINAKLAKPEDLESFFTSLTCIPIEVNMLKGRMSGQAFVKYSTLSEAMEMLPLTHGMELFGKALWVAYSNKKGES